MAFSFTTATSRAENTSATGFDVDQISFLFWIYPTAWAFGTVFAADEAVLSGGCPIWIHMDEGNNGIAFRYYRSGNRGQWVSNTIALNEWICIGITYDRTSLGKPTIYTRRVGTHSSLQVNSDPTQVQDPSGTANSPSAGYTVSDQDFAFAGRIAYPQVWSRILTHGEMEFASRHPGSIPRSSILFLGDDRGTDLSGNGRNATLTNTSVGDNPPVWSAFSGWRHRSYSVTSTPVVPYRSVSAQVIWFE